MRRWYLDTSAAVKLVRRERESRALLRWLADRSWMLSDLHRTELRKAAARTSAGASARADRLLAEADLLALHPAIFDGAGGTGPPTLRSLDALHLAVAQSLGPDLEGIVAYDDRLLEAAKELGIPTASPGRRRS